MQAAARKPKPLTVALLGRVYGVGESQIRRWQDKGVNLASPEELRALLQVQRRVGAVGRRLLEPDGMEHFRQRLAVERYTPEF